MLKSTTLSAILYGIGLFVLLWLLKTLEWQFLVKRNSFDIYAGLIALLFLLLGVWASKHLWHATRTTQPNHHNHTLTNTPEQNSAEPGESGVKAHGISKRELEVLLLMAKGYSNQEIADQLFVSLNTIKTHISKLLEKLEASRRTQAIQKARDLGIIP